MNSENVVKSNSKEREHRLTDEHWSVIKHINAEREKPDLENDCVKGNIPLKVYADLLENSLISDRENIKITIWRDRKILINKALVPLRITVFLWFASGNICTLFFSLSLTHRGLKLSEFSSVFSMLFLLQFTVAYICGIIADKLGNAKPVLLFLMLGTISIVVGLLLSPDVTDKSCLERGINLTCMNDLNYTSGFQKCKNVCSTNNSDYYADKAEVNNNSHQFVSMKSFDNVNMHEFQKTFDSNGTKIFCQEMCSCSLYHGKNCSSILKTEFKILYSFIFLSFYSFWSTSYRFLDFESVNAAKNHNSDFGNERLYGVLGSFIVMIMCNFVLNIDTSGTRAHFDNVFWFAVVLYLMALVSAFNINNVILPPGLNLTKKSLKVFTDIEILSFILIAFAAGTAYTFNHFFQLLFLDSLMASKTVIGVHIIATILYGFPIYITSKWWLRKLGTKVIIIITLLCYTLNGISYSFLYNPWFTIIIAITTIFPFNLFWIATVVHCREIAPAGFAATLNAVIGTVHFGIGRSFSVSVGSYLMDTYGARTTFRSLAGFCLVAAILYSVFVYLKYLNSTNKSKKQSEDPEEMKSMKENEA